jgi:cell division protein ZapA
VSAKKNLIRVTIAGEEYPLRTDSSPEHARAVAQYVDRAIRQVIASRTVVETHKAAILAALQITDELFQEREVAAALSESMRSLSADVRRLLPPAKRVSGGNPAVAPHRAPASVGGDGGEQGEAGPP